MKEKVLGLKSMGIQWVICGFFYGLLIWLSPPQNSFGPLDLWMGSMTVAACVIATTSRARESVFGLISVLICAPLAYGIGRLSYPDLEMLHFLVAANILFLPFVATMSARTRQHDLAQAAQRKILAQRAKLSVETWWSTKVANHLSPSLRWALLMTPVDILSKIAKGRVSPEETRHMSGQIDEHLMTISIATDVARTLGSGIDLADDYRNINGIVRLLLEPRKLELTRIEQRITEFETSIEGTRH